MQNPQQSRIVLVTGASLGIGADIARQLSGPDTHVVAAQVADGTRAAELIDNVAQRFGRLDTLILNASTALGRDADARYALSLNRDAQRRLVELALPLMPAGGHIVFVTSHQTALYAMHSEFHRAGIRFTVVSGDAADGTVASAVVNAATTPDPPGLVCVGGADYLMTALPARSPSTEQGPPSLGELGQRGLHDGLHPAGVFLAGLTGRRGHRRQHPGPEL